MANQAEGLTIVFMMPKERLGLLWWLSGKESSHSAGDTGYGVLSLSGEEPLEEGMATHFSILAWRIPWTEEPGRLQSIGLQSVRHD